MIQQLLFNKKAFLRILISYVIMVAFWSFACYWFDQQFQENRFYLKAIGFIAVFSLSFIVGLGIKKLDKIIALFTIFLIAFYLVSLVIGPISAYLTNNSLWLSGLIMSSIAAIILVKALSIIGKVEFTYACVIATIICAIPAYLLLDKDFGNGLYLNYNLHPSIVMFNLWQGFTIIPLAVGLCVRKAAANNGFGTMARYNKG